MTAGPRKRSPAGVGGGFAASRRLATASLGLALLAGPVTVAACVTSAVALARSDDRHWTEVARYGLGTAALVIVIECIVGLNPLVLLYAGVAHWLAYPSLWPLDVVNDFAPGLPLAGSLGFGLGGCLIGSAEARAVGADWHPLEQRFYRVEAKREAARMRAAATNAKAQNACASPPLGVSYDDGDLGDLRDGAFVTLAPLLERCVGLAIIGAAGSGKTETIKRIVAILGWLKFAVILGDWKGDEDLIDPAVAAFLSWHEPGRVVVHTFPEEPIDGWRGTPDQITSRMIGVHRWSEDYYEAGARSVIDWLVAGGCSSSSEFLSRMTLGYLQKKASGDPTAVAEMEALKNNRAILDGARMRFSGFFRALRGAYDGTRSWGDAHVFVLTVNALAARADAEAQVRMLLNDVMQWATDPVRRPDRSQKFVLILDEFSEMAETAAELVITMAERIRSAGGLIIVSSQSYEGLGVDDQQRDRLLAALAGGVILHRCSTPERLCELAGTERRPEQSWQLDDTSHSGMGSMRVGFRMKLLPDTVRQARTGEAFVISGGRYAHVQVLQAETDSFMGVAAKLHDESRQRGQNVSTPSPQQAEALAIENPPPSFLGDLEG